VSALLEVSHLAVSFEAGRIEAVSEVSFTLSRGRTLAIVGESGSGKTMTALAVGRLTPAGARLSGHVLLDGADVLAMSGPEVRTVRGGRIGFVFQDPYASLDPLMRIGDQIAEAARAHGGWTRRQARAHAVELLTLVHISEPERRARQYPHELSGGMRQRVMIAIALAGDPELLVADEPTTALDVTVQGQILDLLAELQQRLGLGLLLISHDLGVVARAADDVLVMYAGRVVERGTALQVFDDPQHPYTWGLLSSIPRAVGGRAGLRSIPGAPPVAGAIPAGCAFHPRCVFAFDRCRTTVPPLVGAEGHLDACLLTVRERGPARERVL